MDVKRYGDQHEVLVTFIRYTLHFWGPWDRLPLSYFFCPTCHATNRVRRPRPQLRILPPRIQVPPELNLVLTRAKLLSEECCRPLPPLIAALRHADRSQEFTDILKEIQWYVSVVSHDNICENVEDLFSPEFRRFPWDSKIGYLEQDMLKKAEQGDWYDLMQELDVWDRGHECSSKQCGNSQESKDPHFCLAAQFLEKRTDQVPRSDDDDHLSTLWRIDDEAVEQGRLLGSGSYSAVVEATWLGNKYALKLFTPAGLTSLRTEAEALAKLNHPHIVKIHACSNNSLLLDLMTSDLHKFIRVRMQGGVRVSPFSLRAALNLMLQIADAVNYLHNNGIAHRDLKSANILVNLVKEFGEEDGYVFAKVADFGLAKVKHEITSYSHLTHNVGTRRWTAPEIFGANIDDQHLEHAYPMKADVYSFGIICFEILSGEEPFKDVPLSLLYSKLTSEFPLRPQLPITCPTALASLICSCWGADPRERPTFANVCKVLRYLTGMHLSQESRWNRIDMIRPFGRLSALMKVEGSLIDNAGGDGGVQHVLPLSMDLLMDIRGVEIFEMRMAGRRFSLGFDVSYYSREQDRRIRIAKDEGTYISHLNNDKTIQTEHTYGLIKFEYPSEYLIQVEYMYKDTCLSYLSFLTTKARYGPYGTIGSFVKQLPATPKRIVGFHFSYPDIKVYSIQEIVGCLEHYLV